MQNSSKFACDYTPSSLLSEAYLLSAQKNPNKVCGIIWNYIDYCTRTHNYKDISEVMQRVDLSQICLEGALAIAAYSMWVYSNVPGWVNYREKLRKHISQSNSKQYADDCLKIWDHIQ